MARRKKIFASLDQFFELRERLEAAVVAKLIVDKEFPDSAGAPVSYDIEWTPDRECLVTVLSDDATVERVITVDLKDLAAKYLTEADQPQKKRKAAAKAEKEHFKAITGIAHSPKAVSRQTP